MSPAFAKSHRLVVVADSDERFSDFRPFVASINDSAEVAFQVALGDGSSGVFVASGGSKSRVAGGADVAVISHPDINNEGSTCFYGVGPAERQTVVRVAGGATAVIAETGDQFRSIGPLGPTMNGRGLVAFRATSPSGETGVYAGDGAQLSCIATTGNGFSAFAGLPVVTNDDRVFFRGTLDDGKDGIFCRDDDGIATIATTGKAFASLGFFPSANKHGAVAFAAVCPGGTSGLFVAADGRLDRIIDEAAPYESFRGALINDAGTVIFFAHPVAGQLGIFSGPDPTRNHILSVGSDLCGSIVSEFALNPVSINRHGQLAIRVLLTDQRQLIVRADPE